MTIKDDGGQAFPLVDHVDSQNNFKSAEIGMSLRDYFAAKAMQGMLAYPGDEQRGSHHNNNDADGVAQMAYQYADAMLAERAK